MKQLYTIVIQFSPPRQSYLVHKAKLYLLAYIVFVVWKRKPQFNFSLPLITVLLGSQTIWETAELREESMIVNEFYEFITYGTYLRMVAIPAIYIGSEMNFHFIWYLWNELCVLNLKTLARRYKTHIEFCKYCMKWKFISDSFYHIFNSQKL